MGAMSSWGKAWGKSWGGSWGSVVNIKSYIKQVFRSLRTSLIFIGKLVTVSQLYTKLVTAVPLPISLQTTMRYDMAETLNIELLQGDSFDWEITVTNTLGAPMNLTGYTVRGMGRLKYSDPLPSFTFTGVVDADQTTNKGLVRISLSDTITAALLVKAFHYDIELVNSTGGVKKLYRGLATVIAEATK